MSVSCATPSGFDDKSPQLDLISPNAGDAFELQETIPLCFILNDSDHVSSQINIDITLDGTPLESSEPGTSSHLSNSDCRAESGQLGLGMYLSNLEAGTHIAEIKVVDPDGQSAQVQVHFIVLAKEEVEATDTPTTTPTESATPSDAPNTPSPTGLPATISPTETPTQTPSKTPTQTPLETPTSTPVVANSPPSCDILSPVDGRALSSENTIAFAATAYDEESPPNALFVFWSSDPPTSKIDGRGGYVDQPGTLAFEVSDLPGGLYSVTLTVQDEDLNRGTCLTTFEVLNCGDSDGDGYSDCEDAIDIDCDDTDPNTHPYASDNGSPGDGQDNDCDGTIDEDMPLDFDGDGLSPASGDCNDWDPNIYPGATEIPDGKDQDCDDIVDEDTSVSDDDADTFTEEEGDCDDANPEIFPGAEELENAIDDDCDTVIDEGTAAFDDDFDGYAENDGDCDDQDANVAPGLSDELDGIDNDCDGSIDEDGPQDNDGDGVFAGQNLEDDCNDDDASIYPGAEELPNGQDDDCDGLVDENTTLFDDDADGYAESEGDCDDANPAIHPEQLDPVDGFDNDCDDAIDEDGPQPGELVITEVRRQTNGEDPSDVNLQWFEVYNPSERVLELRGLTLEVMEGHPMFGDTFFEEMILPEDSPALYPDAYMVIGRSTDPGQTGGAVVDIGYGDMVLAGMGGVALWSGSQLLDSVDWDDGIFYPTAQGASITLDPPTLSGATPPTEANDTPTNWCLSTTFYGRDLMGTPGSPGDLCH